MAIISWIFNPFRLICPLKRSQIHINYHVFPSNLDHNKAHLVQFGMCLTFIKVPDTCIQPRHQMQQIDRAPYTQISMACLHRKVAPPSIPIEYQTFSAHCGCLTFSQQQLQQQQSVDSKQTDTKIIRANSYIPELRLSREYGVQVSTLYPLYPYPIISPQPVAHLLLHYVYFPHHMYNHCIISSTTVLCLDWKTFKNVQ